MGRNSLQDEGAANFSLNLGRFSWAASLQWVRGKRLSFCSQLLSPDVPPPCPNQCGPSGAPAPHRGAQQLFQLLCLWERTGLCAPLGAGHPVSVLLTDLSSLDLS